MKDNQQLEKLQFLSSDLSELIDNLDAMVHVINNKMQECNNEHQLENLQEISSNVSELSSSLNSVITSVNKSTELKRMMLEMLKDNQEMNEKMRKYRDEI